MNADLTRRSGSAEPLHPDFQRFVDQIAVLQAAGAPKWDQLSAEQLRAATKDIRKAAAPVQGVARRNLWIAGAQGRLGARLYTPDGGDAPGPGLVYFHGGGFSIGSVETHDSIVAKLARFGGEDPVHRIPAGTRTSLSHGA